MKTMLVVTQPFADYAKGDHITDHKAMEAALATNEAHVVRAAHPGDEFYPEVEATAAKPRKAAAKAEAPADEPQPAA